MIFLTKHLHNYKIHRNLTVNSKGQNVTNKFENFFEFEKQYNFELVVKIQYNKKDMNIYKSEAQLIKKSCIRKLTNVNLIIK